MRLWAHVCMRLCACVYAFVVACINKCMCVYYKLVITINICSCVMQCFYDDGNVHNIWSLYNEID